MINPQDLREVVRQYHTQYVGGSAESNKIGQVTSHIYINRIKRDPSLTYKQCFLDPKPNHGT